MAESSHKRIVITGATRGLGRALAEGFARLGHAVIGCGRDAGAIEVLRAALGAPHDFEAVDIARGPSESLGRAVPRRIRRARPADQQRSPDQPQRADLGGPRRGVRPSHRREHQGGRQRPPPRRAGDDRAGVRGDRQPQLVLGPFRLARGRPVLRLEVGDRGSDAAPWPRNSRRAWPPSPSTRASSTPRCSAAPSARRPATT